MESLKKLLVDYSGIDDEYHDSIQTYLQVLKLRHHPTYLHSLRVGKLASEIAIVAANPAVTPKLMWWAGLLHDIGKSLIPPEYLTKTEGFDEDDYKVMENHVMYGFLILQKLHDYTAHVIVRHHRYGKRPYPETLPELPSHLNEQHVEEAAEFVALADYYDALTSRKNDHHHRCPLSREQRREMYHRENAKHEALIQRLEAVGIFTYEDTQVSE